METSISPRHILFATDFSALAENALNTAVSICQRHSATLHIFHAMDISFGIQVPDAHHSPVCLMPGMEEIHRENLDQLAKQVEAESFIPVSTHLRYGKPAYLIADIAYELGCDLIVMGTHGENVPAKYLMGTTAFSTIKNTKVAVLTVPGIREVKAFKKILFPIRATSGIMYKYRFIRPIIKRNHAELIIAALSQQDENYAYDFLLEKLDELSVMLKKDNIAFTSSVQECGNYAEKVMQIASEENADLIVINASLGYKWSEFFTGPYTQQMVNRSAIPILSIRTDDINSSLKKSLELQTGTY